MTESLDNRHALVCGASMGIGRETALALARRGAAVTGLARSEEKLAALVDELKAAGAADAGYLAVDLEDEKAVVRVVQSALDEAGPVHILINNTGGPPSGRLLNAERHDLAKAFHRHVLGAHLMLGLVLPGMEAAGYGRIVNVLSTSVREPIPNLGVSNTIRAAMAGWSKTLSHELPPGITINNVLPGFTATSRLRSLGDATAERTGRSYEEVEKDWLAAVPEGRLADPSETAGLIAFLASPAGGYIRGQSIAIDGGRMRSI